MFRKKQMSHILQAMDEKTTLSGTELAKEINILNTIYWIDYA